MKRLLVACTLFLCVGAQAARADEVCRPCPFDCQGIGARNKDCRDLDRHRGQCCVDLDERGMDQLDRRDDENQYGGRGRRNDPNAYDDRNGFQPGDCPYGYHVNDRPCTNDERRRGCRDTRSPRGETCVGWGR